ncbi:MAG: methyltransferase domain-containing protein [Candidatus Njordarchaeia archaeon]
MPLFGKFFKERIFLGDKVLDLGCGDKTKTAWIKSIGTVVTVDVWPKVNPDYLIDIGKQRLPFKNKEFDVVLMYDVIEHLPKNKGKFALEEAKRVTRRELILVTPLIWDDNKKHVNNPNLWCFGNEYNLHRSLWDPMDFLVHDQGWERILGIKDDEKYFLGIWIPSGKKTN